MDDRTLFMIAESYEVVMRLRASAASMDRATAHTKKLLREARVDRVSRDRILDDLDRP